MTMLLKYRYSTDPDVYSTWEPDELTEELVQQAIDLASLCEQEILDGGHQDDSEESQARFDSVANGFSNEIARRVRNTIPHVHGDLQRHTISFRPPWAEAQREGFDVHVWGVENPLTPKEES